MMRVNHEYQRKGALAYLAAYDVHQARVFSHCDAKTRIVAFMTLVQQVMTQEPYSSAKRVFWVVDNGSSHRGQAAADRLAARFPNAVMIHPDPRLLAPPGEDLLLDHPAQGPDTQRLHQP
jgi:hypothetical protein